MARLDESSETSRLADLAAVEIGAVTGANDFFLLTRDEAKGMPSRIARPAVSKAAQVPGAVLRSKHHDELLDQGRKGLLFVASADDASKLATVRSHIAKGERLGVPAAYKCRIREDWWAVPIPRRGVADLFLTYFASEHPRLVLNQAGVLQTNTVHGVYLSTRIDGADLAAGFYNSLTLLTSELGGRSYGGGVLKLEPTEAGALLMPPIRRGLSGLLSEVDLLIRSRNLSGALDLIDPIVLGDGLGLSTSEIDELRESGERLRARRRSRGRPIRT